MDPRYLSPSRSPPTLDQEHAQNRTAEDRPLLPRQTDAGAGSCGSPVPRDSGTPGADVMIGNGNKGRGSPTGPTRTGPRMRYRELTETEKSRRRGQRGPAGLTRMFKGVSFTHKKPFTKQQRRAHVFISTDPNWGKTATPGGGRWSDRRRIEEGFVIKKKKQIINK